MGISQHRSVERLEPVSLPAPPHKPPQAPSEPPPPSAEPVSAPPAPAPGPGPSPPSTPAPQVVANFEDGLTGWSTAALGDAVPEVVAGLAQDGDQSGVFRLADDQSGSLLILGGDGGPSEIGAVQIHEGDEYAFAFSFYISRMVYGEPGVDNQIMRLDSGASELQSFALQLWEYPGEDWYSAARGLWVSGEATGGDRFLAPVAENAWHEVVVRLRGSSLEAGSYELYLDGQLVDARSGVNTIVPGSSYTQIEVGLLRDGDRLQGSSEILIDAAKLGSTLESVLP